jgi:hypothetical protein
VLHMHSLDGMGGHGKLTHDESLTIMSTLHAT